MSKKSKAKKKVGKGLLNNEVYAVKGSKNKYRATESPRKLEQESRRTESAIKKAASMAVIEKYAKANKISITQAMIHFM